MITKITPISELKQIFLEIFLNKTDKVNDVGADSVLNGIAYGVAKTGQKCLVNQSVIEGHLFPDTAYGVYLDRIASVRGIAPRFAAQGSSTYVRLTADAGTYYDKDLITLTSTTGLKFVLQESVTIDTNGFAYVKVKSQSVGSETNVDPLSINRISPAPQGHINVTNEYRGNGGMDAEPDDLFRKRIKNSLNVLSRPTLSYLEQVFMKINPKVLRLIKSGISSDGRFNLIVVAMNGQDFTEDEFNEILSKSAEYLSLTELYVDNNTYSLKLNNVNWLPVDIEMRVDIDPDYDSEDVRREMQIQINKLFDYRYWKDGDKVEWENILYAAKNVEGVKYIPDSQFSPRNDINVPIYRLPRVRGFILRDLDGNIIEDNNGVMSGVFYPNDIDADYSASVLSNIE